MDLSALESAIKALSASLDALRPWLIFWNVVVVVGLVVEYRPDLAELILKRPRTRRSLWPNLVGGALIVIGISGEISNEVKSFRIENGISTKSLELETLLEQKAGFAKTSADDAVKAAGRAKNEADGAIRAAGSAKTIAGRAETQSTEANGLSRQAIKDAGSAKQGAENVLEQAQELGAKLSVTEKAALPRKLNQKPFADHLKPFKGFPVLIETIADFEAERTAALIQGGLGPRMAEWQVSPVRVRQDSAVVADFFFPGVMVEQNCLAISKSIPLSPEEFEKESAARMACEIAAETLVDQLNANGIEARGPRPTGINNMPLGTIRVRVALKPMPGQPPENLFVTQP